MNKRLQKMIDNNLIPNMEGVFIDAYNQSMNEKNSRNDNNKS